LGVTTDNILYVQVTISLIESSRIICILDIELKG